MQPLEFDLLDWLIGNEGIVHSFGSSCLTFLKLTDFPGFDPEKFDFLLDCGSDMGDPELQQAIADRYSVETKNVAITSSASEGNFLVQALFSPGTIGLETPTYEPLWKLGQMMDSKVEYIERRFEDGFNIREEELKELVGNVSLIEMTNLHNPSGVALGKERMRSIVEICEDAGTTLMVDEIFRNYTDHPSAVDFGENVIINTSPSKFFGACGFRIGHLVGEESLIRKVEKLKILLAPNTAVISQRAYLIMMRNFDWFIKRGRGIMDTNQRMIGEWMGKREDIEWVRSEGNIAFPRICNPGTHEPVDAMELAVFLRDRHHIILTPGKFFGAGYEAHVRMGFGIPEDNLRSGLEALSVGLDEWHER